jgi:hypothetical protein
MPFTQPSVLVANVLIWRLSKSLQARGTAEDIALTLVRSRIQAVRRHVHPADHIRPLGG